MSIPGTIKHETEGYQHGRSKKLGFWSSAALVTGNMIGSGIFLIPASLAIYGSISLLGWLCSSVGAVLLALVFGNLSRLMPHADGGPYAYTRSRLGEFPASIVAWGYWISIWCTNAAIAVALVGYLAVFFPALAVNPSAALAVALGFIWLLTWVNTLPIRTVGGLQLITTILKILPLVLIGCIGIFYVDAGNFEPFNASGGSGFSAITTTATLTLFAFLGLESATIPSSGTENPERIVKRSTIVGTLFTVFIYMVSAVAVIGIVPQADLISSTAPFADAASVFWGSSARYIVAAGAVISTLGALNGWLLLQGQIPMAAARDGLFLKTFGKVNRHGSPAIGIILSSILVSLLILLNYSKGLVEAFTFIMTLSTLATLVPYLFSTAVFALLTRDGHGKRKQLNLILSAIAFLFSLWIIIGCGMEVIVWGSILLLSGIPVFFILKKGRTDRTKTANA